MQWRKSHLFSWSCYLARYVLEHSKLNPWRGTRMFAKKWPPRSVRCLILPNRDWKICQMCPKSACLRPSSSSKRFHHHHTWSEGLYWIQLSTKKCLHGRKNTWIWLKRSAKLEEPTPIVVLAVKGIIFFKTQFSLCHWLNVSCVQEFRRQSIR